MFETEVMQGNGVRNQKNTTPEEITVLLKRMERSYPTPEEDL